MIIPGLESETPPPEQVAAWWVLGLLETDRVPWWAAEWLVQGWDGPALRELAGLGAEDAREIRDLMPSVLQEVAVAPFATQVEAAEACFRYLARLCLQGLVEERWVAWTVDRVLHAVSYVDEAYALPLSGAFGVDEVWDDGFSGSAIELRELVRDACAAQLDAASEIGSG
ncbi:hypothetical protein [Actinoalloteichus hymeniacidonis]|uniref:Uncharacterized protein n=1 Tax=Actinoalloteichus hymeniacidonis TaxID=340345 RepID=A0AAC9MXI3_9PSEU|nr:hypothetical protein [Actinoalloteichus hymeniacidonis]AOS63268.1 hypothetical protein TL08_12270 [Actinoalloteichus hymeniacidonis]MBB5908693.1 hypothetical protein [Actinoalloteichus hymeniacidonis]